MFSQPTNQHQWLKQFLGKWTFETACDMGPDQPPMKSTGEEEYLPLGDLWVIGSGQSQMPDKSPAFSRTTLGFNPKKQKFVGTFIASMMDYLWIYEGAIDDREIKISLETIGPNFGSPDQKLVDYLDVYEFEGSSRRYLKSFQRSPEGEWKQFMEAVYTKVG